MMTNMEARIQRLEDTEAIRRLKQYYYCHCVDRAVAGDEHAMGELISRFAEDMAIDFSGLPVIEGREPVAAFYAQQVPNFMSWCHHRVMNEVIDIDGDTATARWYFDCPAILLEGNPFGILGSYVIAGRYEEEYVRQDGVWKWRKITAILDTQRAFAHDIELLSN